MNGAASGLGEASSLIRRSFWGELEADLSGQLVGDEETDIVVVGAGLAGLSSALHIVRLDPSVHVTIVESEFPGYGASGRNSGNVGQLARSEIGSLIRTLGSDDARFVVQHQARMLTDFEALLKEESIECEFERSDILLLAHEEEALEGLRRIADLHRQYGLPSELIGRVEMSAYVHLDAAGGLSCGLNAFAQPLKLVSGLRDAVIRRGVLLHEASPVRLVSRPSHGGVLLRTDHGTVQAKTCIIATGAYAPSMGVGMGAIHPTYTYQLATAPLEREALAMFGWNPKHRMILDAGLNYYSMQLRPTGQLLMGGGGRPAAPADGRSLPLHDNASEYQRIHGEMLRRFEWLEGVPLECAWGGPVDLTESGRPITALVEDSMYVNAGYNGRGLLMATLSGRVVASDLLGPGCVDYDYARYADLVLRGEARSIRIEYASDVDSP